MEDKIKEQIDKFESDVKEAMGKLDKKVDEVAAKVDPKVDEVAAKVKAELKPSLDKIDGFMDANGKRVAIVAVAAFGLALVGMIGASLLGFV